MDHELRSLALSRPIAGVTNLADAFIAKVHVTVERLLERGGPGWLLGVGQPLLGYRGGPLNNRQPLLTALYSEIRTVTEIYACLTDGSVPLLLTPGLQESLPWLIASRAAQVRASASLFNFPDAIETMFGVSRALMIVFARAVGLVSRTSMGETGDDVSRDHLEYELSALKAELEYVWPARLEQQSAERRLAYGGRLWRRAILVLLLHKVQMCPLNSVDLKLNVTAVLELCTEAVGEMGHLAGWMWPILITACACSDVAQRLEFLQLIRHAKNPIDDCDNYGLAEEMLKTIWMWHDLGVADYHLREVVRDDPSLDVLIY
ncbi:hypothetical protein IAT38_006946 [Cryptococcus sp. DSM 104549]